MSMSVSFISNISTEGAPDVAEGSACPGGAGVAGKSALLRFPNVPYASGDERADADLDLTWRLLGGQLDVPEIRCGCVVDVEVEPEPMAVEPQQRIPDPTPAG